MLRLLVTVGLLDLMVFNRGGVGGGLSCALYSV